jgi:hypothetical protein
MRAGILKDISGEIGEKTLCGEVILKMVLDRQVVNKKSVLGLRYVLIFYCGFAFIMTASVV